MEQKTSWKDLRLKLSQCSSRDLLGLIGDLYDLDAKNKRFLKARFMRNDQNGLEEYQDMIYHYICPKSMNPLRIGEARKVIAEYKKATGDTAGTLDLMIYYVECGNKFTLTYGDIDEAFYSSIESMFDAAIKLLKSAGENRMEVFLPRLFKIVRDTRDIGWGYHDYLADTFYRAFPDWDE